jgi:hypothetical protein
MKIDIDHLVSSVPAVQAFAARVGWPDDPTTVDIADAKQLSARLDVAMRALHDLRPGTKTLVDVDVNATANLCRSESCKMAVVIITA